MPIQRGASRGHVDGGQQLVDQFSNPLTEVEFNQVNPKRKGTASFDRYEGYKKARTVGEALDSGAVKGDLKNDLEKGFFRLLPAGHAATSAAPSAVASATEPRAASDTRQGLAPTATLPTTRTVTRVAPTVSKPSAQPSSSRGTSSSSRAGGKSEVGLPTAQTQKQVGARVGANLNSTCRPTAPTSILQTSVDPRALAETQDLPLSQRLQPTLIQHLADRKAKRESEKGLASAPVVKGTAPTNCLSLPARAAEQRFHVASLPSSNTSFTPLVRRGDSADAYLPIPSHLAIGSNETASSSSSHIVTTASASSTHRWKCEVHGGSASAGGPEDASASAANAGWRCEVRGGADDESPAKAAEVGHGTKTEIPLQAQAFSDGGPSLLVTAQQVGLHTDMALAARERPAVAVSPPLQVTAPTIKTTNTEMSRAAQEFPVAAPRLLLPVGHLGLQTDMATAARENSAAASSLLLQVRTNDMQEATEPAAPQVALAASAPTEVVPHVRSDNQDDTDDELAEAIRLSLLEHSSKNATDVGFSGIGSDASGFAYAQPDGNYTSEDRQRTCADAYSTSSERVANCGAEDESIKDAVAGVPAGGLEGHDSRTAATQSDEDSDGELLAACSAFESRVRETPTPVQALEANREILDCGADEGPPITLVCRLGTVVVKREPVDDDAPSELAYSHVGEYALPVGESERDINMDELEDENGPDSITLILRLGICHVKKELPEEEQENENGVLTGEGQLQNALPMDQVAHVNGDLRHMFMQQQQQEPLVANGLQGAEQDPGEEQGNNASQDLEAAQTASYEANVRDKKQREARELELVKEGHFEPLELLDAELTGKIMEDSIFWLMESAANRLLLFEYLRLFARAKQWYGEPAEAYFKDKRYHIMFELLTRENLAADMTSFLSTEIDKVKEAMYSMGEKGRYVPYLFAPMSSAASVKGCENLDG